MKYGLVEKKKRKREYFAEIFPNTTTFEEITMSVPTLWKN